MRFTAKSTIAIAAVALLAAGCGGGSSSDKAASSAAAAASSASSQVDAAASSASDAASSIAAAASSQVAAATSELGVATSDLGATSAANTGTGGLDTATLIKTALAAQGITLSDDQAKCIVDKAGANIAAQLSSGGAPPALFVAIVRCASSAFAPLIAKSVQGDMPGISSDQATCVAQVTLDALASLDDTALAAAIQSTASAPEAIKQKIIDTAPGKCGVDKGALEKALNKS